MLPNVRSAAARAWIVGLACLSSVAAVAPPAADSAVREAVNRFAAALEAEDASHLRPVLPRHGSVQLQLVRLSSDVGSFTSEQVEALFRDVFDRTTVRSVETLGLEHDTSGLALARARVRVTDRDGRDAALELRLGLREEEGRWVLREIRERPA